jgi:starch synthase
MGKRHVLFAAYEMVPFLKLSDGAKRIRASLSALKELGYELRTMMPKFGVINERRNKLHDVVRLSGINIFVESGNQPLSIKVASIPSERLQIYFLYCEEYFSRKAVFQNVKTKHYFEDNLHRTLFYCKGILETVKKLVWAPEIIHCYGWMTGLVPLYLKHFYNDPLFEHAKVVLTIYEPELDMPYDFKVLRSLLTRDGFDEQLLEPYAGETFRAFVEGACHYADRVTLVPPETVLGPVSDFEMREKFVIEPDTEELAALKAFYQDLYEALLPAETEVSNS